VASLVIDVDERAFQTEVIDRSMTVPVVLDFWADWCQPCKQLSPILERLASDYAGRFVLAKIDTEANQQLAAAAQVRSIPLVLAVIKGQVLPLFEGAVPEAQVRQYLDQMLQVAAANGVTGTVTVAADAAGTGESAEPERDPRFDAADAALERGDVEAARAEFKRLLDAAPADPEAKAGYVQTTVLERALAVDVDAVSAAAEADPADVAAACAMADVEVTGGAVEQAFARLVTAVRLSVGADRGAARARLVELFEFVGPEDPQVSAARRALASALF
jgi:putative thioredoxin